MKHLLVLPILLLITGLAKGSALFSISDAEFVAVTSTQQVRPLGGEGQLKAGEILRLNFTIRGSAIALAALERAGSLSVVTRWWNGSDVTDPGIEVGLDSANWQQDKASLESQVTQNGSFLWHTYADKVNWKPGTITISCLDHNHALAEILSTQTAEIYFKLLN